MHDNDDPSTYPAAPRFNCDVFLSFNGKDTSRSLIKHLCDSLTEHGVRFVQEDIGISEEDEIDLSLIEAIEDSAASIVIISPSYANSCCRLEALSRICELRRRVLPVFHQVNPSHVRRQEGPFKDDFRNYLERFGEDKVSKWRRAMKKVGGLSGFVIDNSSKEQHLIKQLVSRVLTELRKTVGIAAYTVAVDARADELMRKLNVKSNQIKVLGLHGMGGIGKTTLAKVLYNKLISHFEYRCFILNVREVSEEHDGLTSLQKKILRDLSSNVVASADEIGSGITAIKQMLHEKRVLMVLDDVNEVSQLNALAGNKDWFGDGSRIIITARNKEVLVEYLVDEFYEVEVLDSANALQLFSYHSLRREKPIDGYEDLSKQIVSVTGGLPLALEVFGSYLFHMRRIEEWEDALKKLQHIRPYNLQDVLRISFDGLDEEEKHVFLDIACFFVNIGMKREEAVDILKGCGFKAEAAITVLTAKSLIKITEDYSLWMHDQLRDMGRQIVQLENLLDPGMRSRLWDHNEIMTVLKQKKGTKYVQGIILDFSKKKTVEDLSADATFRNNFLTTPNLDSALVYVKEICKRILLCLLHGEDKKKEPKLSTEFFESMVNLRLLQINRATLEGKFKCIPAELKWLQWRGCPLKYLPYDYCPRKLTVLDLSESGIERVWVWGSNKVAENLVVMNLQGCYSLVAVSDLSGCKSLEKLNLEHCGQLTKIDKSVGKLKTLLHLNLRGCSNIVEFPSDFSGLKQLKTLILSDCAKLKELPYDIGSMNSLKQLLADGTAISKLPESIYQLTKLEKLNLNGCQFIKQLPKCLGNLNSLKDLSLNQSALEELPDSIRSLLNLEKLSLMWCKSLTRIPESISNLQSLTKLLIDNSGIKELHTSIGSLCYLKVLSAGGCSSLTNLPDSIEGLASISELQLDSTSITGLPHQIGTLKMIENLSMRKCMSLRYLPEAIGNMLSLTALNLFGANIVELPESFGMLENLIRLKLDECKELQKLPASIGNLKSLRSLFMQKTAVTELPENFGMLSSLTVLRMGKKPLKYLGKQEKLVLLPTSFSNLSLLEELDAHAWRISGIPDSFEKLSMLEIVKLGHNNICSLPTSLKGLSLLKKLYMPWCEELVSLPPLPPSLEELDIANCTSLESIYDVSNLERLELLNLTNCAKVVDIPGLECLKSLKRLYMSGCGSCSSAVKRRLSKVCLRNIYNISIPGSKIPDWFCQKAVSLSEFKNREIRAVIACAVLSLNHEIPDELRDELPVLPAIQARVLKLNKPIANYTLPLLGVPKTNEDQIHFCRFSHCHRLISGWKSGYKLEVGEQNPPIIKGVEMKKCGVFPVYENDDDWDGDEESLDESQKSVSEKLAKFFNSMEEDDYPICSS